MVKGKLGTGIIDVKNDNSIQAFIECDDYVGYWYDKGQKKFIATKRVQVKYALGGGNIHIIPVMERKWGENGMMDILDQLQAIKGVVQLELHSGEMMLGKPDCIVYDEDDNGDETIKKIRFEPYQEPYAVYYGLDDIKGFREIGK